MELRCNGYLYIASAAGAHSAPASWAKPGRPGGVDTVERDPLGAALDLVGDRWWLFIVRDLLRGRARLNDLQRSVVGIATNILASRLKRLEEAGVVERRIHGGPAPISRLRTDAEGARPRCGSRCSPALGRAILEHDLTLVDQRCGHRVELTYGCSECGRGRHGRICASWRRERPGSEQLKNLNSDESHQNEGHGQDCSGHDQQLLTERQALPLKSDLPVSLAFDNVHLESAGYGPSWTDSCQKSTRFSTAAVTR